MSMLQKFLRLTMGARTLAQLPMGSPRLCAFVAALAALSAPGALAATDFSGETEFPSSGSSKYPDTRNVVPYQPVRQQARPRDFQR